MSKNLFVEKEKLPLARKGKWTYIIFMMTKAEALKKMNYRHGTDYSDFFMMLLWLRKGAERCTRKGYLEQAEQYQADYNELLKAE